MIVVVIAMAIMVMAMVMVVMLSLLAGPPSRLHVHPLHPATTRMGGHAQQRVSAHEPA
jgi:hypothetical protein